MTNSGVYNTTAKLPVDLVVVVSEYLDLLSVSSTGDELAGKIVIVTSHGHPFYFRSKG